MSCVHTFFSPGDEENFTHRPGILHLHKSVMVDAFYVEFRDAHRHKAHFVLQTLRAAQTTRRQEINCMGPQQPITLSCLLNWLLKTGKLHQMLVDGCSPHPHSVPYTQPSPINISSLSLCVFVCVRVFCAPMWLHRVYLVTLLTCVLSCKQYLRKASKKELLIIQQSSVM